MQKDFQSISDTGIHATKWIVALRVPQPLFLRLISPVPAIPFTQRIEYCHNRQPGQQHACQSHSRAAGGPAKQEGAKLKVFPLIPLYKDHDENSNPDQYQVNTTRFSESSISPDHHTNSAGAAIQKAPVLPNQPAAKFYSWLMFLFQIWRRKGIFLHTTGLIVPKSTSHYPDYL